MVSRLIGCRHRAAASPSPSRLFAGRWPGGAVGRPVLRDCVLWFSFLPGPRAACGAPASPASPGRSRCKRNAVAPLCYFPSPFTNSGTITPAVSRQTTSASKTPSTVWATVPCKCFSMPTPTGYPAARKKSPHGLTLPFRPHRSIMKHHLTDRLENAVSATLLYGCCKTAMKTKKRALRKPRKTLEIYQWRPRQDSNLRPFDS